MRLWNPIFGCHVYIGEWRKLDAKKIGKHLVNNRRLGKIGRVKTDSISLAELRKEAHRAGAKP